MRWRACTGVAVIVLAFIACGGDGEPGGPPHAIASVGPTAAGGAPISLDDEWYWMVRVPDARSTSEAISVLGDELDGPWQEVGADGPEREAPAWSRTGFVRPSDHGRQLVWWVGSLDDYQAEMPSVSPFSVDQVDEASEDGLGVLVVQQHSISG